MEGYVSEDDNGITVVLDTNLSEELLEEGFVREIISKVQTMRKEADFEVMDKIVITYEGSEKAETVFAKNADEIGAETLALEVKKATPAGYVKEWKINGEAVTLGVEEAITDVNRSAPADLFFILHFLKQEQERIKTI